MAASVRQGTIDLIDSTNFVLTFYQLNVPMEPSEPAPPTTSSIPDRAYRRSNLTNDSHEGLKGSDLTEMTLGMEN
jgi:hypothetical protein